MDKIESISLIVKDTAKALEFCTKKLGGELEEYPQGVSATCSDPDWNLFTIRGPPQKDS
jgi:hypothetical protein